MQRYQYAPGLAFIGEMGGGLLVPQAYVFNFRRQKVEFSDDLIFSPEKQGLFQLVILPDDVTQLEPPARDLNDLTFLSNGLLLPIEATIIIQSTQATLPMAPDNTSVYQHQIHHITRLATGDEFAASPTLCKNRPPPIGYDPMRMRKEVAGKKYVIIRPDRFVYAACDTVMELKQAVSKLSNALHMK